MHQPFDDDFPMEEINLVDLYKEEVDFLKKQNEHLEQSKTETKGGLTNPSGIRVERGETHGAS